MDALPRRVLVVGPGLLGTSLALGLKTRGYSGQITGISRRQTTLELARVTGGYDRLTLDLAEAVGGDGSLLVVLAVPLGSMRAVMSQLAEHLPAGAVAVPGEVVLTDVGSTKASVQADAEAAFADVAGGPGASRFVGSHPMAGSEHQGPEHGDAHLFKGKPCIVCPSDQADADAVEVVEQLWDVLGMRRVRMTPQQHDADAATISHLPHALAAALMHTAAERGGLQIASTGFAGATRLASSNPPMRADIMRANRPALKQALAAMRAQLDELEQHLTADQPGPLLDWLELAKSSRRAWQAGQ